MSSFPEFINIVLCDLLFELQWTHSALLTELVLFSHSYFNQTVIIYLYDYDIVYGVLLPHFESKGINYCL